MKKKLVSVDTYQARLREMEVELNAIADACEAEKREMTADERIKVECYDREKQIIDLRIRAANANGGYYEVPTRAAQFDAWLRENLKDGRRVFDTTIQREAIVTTGATSMIPLTINDIIEPLEEGLILSKIGIRLLTGLKGDYCWPTVGTVEASFADEAVALSDSKIEFGAIRPNPKRLGITILISSQTITQTDGVALDVVKVQIPLAVTRVLNKLMFSTEEFNAAVKGPFVAAAKETAVSIDALTTKKAQRKAYNLKFAAALPTYKELLAMKGCVLARGVEPDGTMCYIMDEYTKSQLESTPRDVGSGLMIVEDGKIAGVPIFCTNYINKEETSYIGFGVFSNVPIGQFGDMRFTVDPISEAVKDATRLTLNGDWSMTVLRKEAFVIGTPTVAVASAAEK